MRTFTDNQGWEWTVEINVAALKRVRGLTGVDLMEVLEGSNGLIEKLVRDPVLLCDVIYAACKPQADERQISDEAFGASMAGDAIEHATAALLEELVDFCPSPRDRANLGRVLKATRDVMDKARDLVERRIGELIDGGALERAVFEAVPPEAAGGSFGSAPASLASIRPP
ncbi:MAG: hypothetical protein DYG94_06380 [Leptolyngbya sp. PLA3]|nr:MAG: hypothetical protein EDM82_05660 [Cyanobacteria bacterium CYA]MCE7968356.1 hypothetical protein [Leptolyngbya sp. PL-A3]